jgi:hypothetical protein
MTIIDAIFCVTSPGWRGNKNNEKYEQYITRSSAHLLRTSTLACNNVRPVVYPPSDGEHEAQGIAGNLEHSINKAGQR